MIIEGNQQPHVTGKQLYGNGYTKRIDLFITEIASAKNISGDPINVIADNRFYLTGLAAGDGNVKSPQPMICPDAKTECNHLKPFRKIYMDVYYDHEFSKVETVVCLATLSIYPCKETYNFRVKAIVLDEQGKNLKTYEFGDSYVQWIELFLLPVGIFQDLQTDQKTVRNLVQLVIATANSDGLLN